MTKHKFLIPAPGGKPGEKVELTTIVMDEDEFDALVGHIAAGDPVINVKTRNRMTPADVEALREGKVVPLVARGTKTEYLFKLYEIDSNHFSAIVRGQGAEAVARVGKR